MKIASLVILSFFIVVVGLVPVTSADPGKQNKVKAYNAQAREKGLSREASGFYVY